MQNNNLKLWKQGMLIFFLLPLLLCGIQSCNSAEPEPPPPKPPGYQEDIPWPSLADSPWPMYRADPQSTGRFSGITQIEGRIDWIYKRGEQNGIIQSSTTVDKNDNIYFGCSGKDSILIIMNNQGESIFYMNPQSTNSTDIIFTTPLLLQSDFYFGIYGFDNFLNLDYSFSIISNTPNIRTPNIGVNVDKEGVVYLIQSGGVLTAFQDNNILWTFTAPDFDRSPYSTSFSPDGKTLYILGVYLSLHSFNVTSKEVNWSFGDGRTETIPLVDNEGNVYIVTSKASIDSGYATLYCLNESGDINWYYKTPYPAQNISIQSPTMDSYGNIYFGKQEIYSINHLGEINWKKDVDGIIYSSLVCDQEGSLYFITTTPQHEGKSIYGMDKHGNILFQTEAPSELRGSYSPSINKNGELIISGRESILLLKII